MSAEANYDGQSLQKAKISGLFYTLWYPWAEEMGIQKIKHLLLTQRGIPKTVAGPCTAIGRAPDS